MPETQSTEQRCTYFALLLLLLLFPLTGQQRDPTAGSEFDVHKAQLRQNPYSRHDLYQMALLLFQRAEYAAARPYIEQLVVLQRSDLKVIALQGRILTGDGDFQAAEALYRKQLADSPYEPDLLAGLAELLFLTEREEESRQQYLQLLRNQPNNRRALMAMIFIEQSKGNLPQSINYLERLLQSHYHDRQVHTLASRFYFDLQNWKAAEEQLDQLQLWQDQNTWQENWLRARIAMAQGQLSQAQQLLQQQLQRYPTVPLLWYTLAENYRLDQKAEQAVEAMNAAVRLAPEVQLYQIASEQLALRYLSPEHPLRQGLAQERFQQGELAKLQGRSLTARVQLRRATQLQPQVLRYWLASAQDLLESKSFQTYLQKLHHRKALFPLEDHEQQVKMIEASISPALTDSVDVAKLQPFRYPMQLVALTSQNQNSHANLSEYLAFNVQDQLSQLHKTYFLDEPVQLKRNERLDLMEQKTGEVLVVQLHVREAGELLQLRAKIFLSRSEETIGRADFFTTDLKIDDLGRQLSQWIDQLLPPVISIVEQKFSRVILDQGRMRGLDNKQLWNIMGRGRPVLSAKYPYLTVPDRVEGQVEVEWVGEQLAQGRLKLADPLSAEVEGAVLIPHQGPPPPAGGRASSLSAPSSILLRSSLLSW